MAESNLKFCALGALYNGEKAEYFECCLKSLDEQTIKIPIYIVIDGFIREELETVIKNYEHLNIVLLRKNENEGLAKALQHGLKMLHKDFDYVIRFDSDDINREDRFLKIKKFCTEFKPDVVSSHMFEIDDTGEVFSQRNVPVSTKKIKNEMAHRNPINHPASAFRLKSVLSVGGYQAMPFFEDWYLWLRVLKAGGKILNINDHLVSFRATDEMISRRYGLNYMKHEAHFFLIRDKEKLVSPLRNWLGFLVRFLSKSFGFKFYKKLFFWSRKLYS